METNTSRRGVIGGVGIAAAVFTAPAVAGRGSPDRSAWTQALASYRAATDAFSQANEAQDHAQGAYFERAPTRPTFVMELEGDYGRLGKHVLPITILHEELDDPNRIWTDPERISGMRAELATYRSAIAALRVDLHLHTLEEAADRALSKQSEALRTLIAHPAPDLVTLGEKLSIILTEFDDHGDATASVLADVRRLEKQEG